MPRASVQTRPETTVPATNANSSERSQPLPLPIGSFIAGVVSWALGDDSILGVRDPGLLVLGAATLLLGGVIFLRHGASQITGPGIASLTVAITAGYGSIYYWADETSDLGPVRIGLWMNFLSLIFMYALWWRHPLVRGPLRIRSRGVTTALLIIGLVVTAAGTLLPLLAPYAQGVVFGGCTLVIVAALAGRSNLNAWMVPLAISAVMFLIFASVGFSGYGRIVVAQLVLVVGVIWSGYVGRWLKVAGAAIVAPALALLAAMRRRFGEEEHGAELSGIGSVVEPVRDLGLLAQKMNDGDVPHGQGSTFLATLGVPIPGSFWPDKPPGFGAVLTEILRPDLAKLDIGQSLAATAPAQWFYDFGHGGLLLMIIALGWAIGKIDSVYATLTISPVTTTGRATAAIAALLAATGLMTLMWGDTFTYASRFMIQFAIPLALLSVIMFASPPPPKASEASYRRGVVDLN